MDKKRIALSVTVDSDDHQEAEMVLSHLEPYRAGEVERTRDFGVSIALVASGIALAKAIIELWRTLKTAPAQAQSTARRATVTVEARDGSVLLLAQVKDPAEIKRFLAQHGG